MTMHAAKGLEFRAVFLPCLEDGILPFYGLEYAEGEPPADTREKAELLREEARILYVGITRAAEAVFTSFAAERKIYGRSVSSGASPCLPPTCSGRYSPHGASDAGPASFPFDLRTHFFTPNPRAGQNIPCPYSCINRRMKRTGCWREIPRSPVYRILS